MVFALTAWASRAAMLPALAPQCCPRACWRRNAARAAMLPARMLASPAPFPPLAGWAFLTAAAVAPHRMFLTQGKRAVGPDGICSPRHPTLFRISPLEEWRAER